MGSRAASGEASRGLDKIGSGLDRQAAGPFLFVIAEQTGLQNHL